MVKIWYDWEETLWREWRETSTSAKTGVLRGDTSNATTKTARRSTARCSAIDIDPQTFAVFDYGSYKEREGNGAHKPVSRMSLAELKTKAAEMGLEVVEADTKQTLVDKINAAKKDSE